jgi:DNA-binding transcriptional regulator GbsR (MarR family)
MYTPNIEKNKATILGYIYRANKQVGGEDIRTATGLEAEQINEAVRQLDELRLVSEYSTLGVKTAPYDFSHVEIRPQGKVVAEKKEPLSKYTLASQSEDYKLILQKLDELKDRLEQTNRRVEDLDSKTERLTSTIEDESFLRPKFLESSPAQRTFGRQVEGILSNILESGSKKVEICIMGYFDHDSLDKLKEVLARKGKVKIVCPDLTTSKQDQGNLDALKRIEDNGAEVRIHPMLHARIFYLSRDGQPWGAIVGSGDIKSDCLGGRRFDASIWSNYPDIIKSVVDFFNRVWDDKGIKRLSEIGKGTSQTRP